MGWSVEEGVGRLIEVRIVSPVAVAELGPFGARLASLLAGHDKAILCTDLTQATTFPPVVAETFLALMRKDNPKVLRSVFLFENSASFGLQIHRMLQESGNPARRAFNTVPELVAWVGEVATPAERARASAFLGPR